MCTMCQLSMVRGGRDVLHMHMAGRVSLQCLEVTTHTCLCRGDYIHVSLYSV